MFMLKNTRAVYDILNRINKRPIKYLITDLYNEAADQTDTRLKLWVRK